MMRLIHTLGIFYIFHVDLIRMDERLRFRHDDIDFNMCIELLQVIKRILSIKHKYYEYY